MNMLNGLKKLSAAALLGAMTLPALAEDKLTLVYPFPDHLYETKECKKLVDAINEKGKGVVQIEVLPYNSVTMFQQPTAVRERRVDLTCTSSAFYARALPEVEALWSSHATPASMRAGGAYDLLDKLHQEQMGLKLLGWTQSGVEFRIYTQKPIEFTAEGLPNLAGHKMRDNATVGAFLRALGATPHSIETAEVYSALQAGTIDSTPWTGVGLIDVKWDQFLKHALLPDTYQVDIVWIANLESWNGLTDESKNVLTDAIVEAEMRVRSEYLALRDKEVEALKAKGMEFHEVPNKEAFLKLASDTAYARIRERLQTNGRSADHLEALRAAFEK